MNAIIFGLHFLQIYRGMAGYQQYIEKKDTIHGNAASGFNRKGLMNIMMCFNRFFFYFETQGSDSRQLLNQVAKTMIVAICILFKTQCCCRYYNQGLNSNNLISQAWELPARID